MKHTANTPELAIVMPCLNEAETLATCIRKADGFLRKNHLNGIIIIGDNGSTDGSVDIARKEGARVVHISQRGYGAALFGATEAAEVDLIIMGDADDSYDFSHLMPILEKLRAGYDLVMGNRFKGGIEPGAMPFKNRYLGNPVLSFLGRLFFRSRIGDFHCGLRGFTKEAFNRMKLVTTGMEYASEMVIKATLLKMKIAEVPVKLYRDGRSRSPHLKPWRDGWRHLRFMLLYSPRWLFFYPGMLLALAGVISMGVLIAGPVTINAVTFDIHTMLYAGLAVITGLQAVIFAFLTRISAVRRGLVMRDNLAQLIDRFFHVEAGVITGLILITAGIALSAASLQGWYYHDLGELNPQMSMRTVIPAVVVLSAGIQILFSGFFIGVMRMNTRSVENADFKKG